MIKAPRRSVASPGEGGALPARPRGSNGRFVKLDATPEVVSPALPGHARKSKARITTSTPAQLVTRVTRAIERELEQIEGIVGGPRTEADKRVRTLASLSRTLAELMRLGSEARTTQREAKANPDDDAVPRDLDDFRRTLERRLAQLVDPPEVVPARGDDAG